MKLTSQLTALREETRGLTASERARHCCDLAKQLEKAGEYDAACEALSEFWPDRDRPPKLDGLDKLMRAKVLLRVGALAGWLGGADQTEGSQETAKNLITKSIEIFEGLGQSEKAAEARGDLALSYWREGSYDEARIHLANALTVLQNDDSDRKAVLLIRAGIIEERTRRLQDALRFYNEAAPLVERSEDHSLKGSFHFEYGLALRGLSAPENRGDYLDRALIEYAASSFHYEQAGNVRALARVETNLGYLFFTIGRYKDAHKHLDRARHFFMNLKDAGMIAQVDDTRARTLLAEGHFTEAQRVARYAVQQLEKGDERAALAGALITHGVAFARLGDHPSARRLFQRAIEVAETAGDPEGAGRAKLSIIEELSGQTPAPQLVSIYQSAAELLKQSQDPSTSQRLIACAQKLIAALGGAEIGIQLEDQDAKLSWASFKREVRRAEKALIERALRQGGGSVTKAALLLGFKHHQSLISIINLRHKDLLKTRSRIRKRRHHLFSEPRRIKKTADKKSLAEILVVHLEENESLMRLLQETLSNEGMHVDSCVGGARALKILKTRAQYDTLIVDNDLPASTGLELVQRIREIAHRRELPIIMLSGVDCEKEAWRAGVKAFLRKPEDINKIASTINRLLADRKEKKR